MSVDMPKMKERSKYRGKILECAVFAAGTICHFDLIYFHVQLSITNVDNDRLYWVMLDVCAVIWRTQKSMHQLLQFQSAKHCHNKMMNGVNKNIQLSIDTWSL